MQLKPKSNRLQITILTLLKNMGAKTKGLGVSLFEVQNYCNLNKSYTTLFKNAKVCIEQGYIAMGVQDGKCNTYYITEKGIEFLKEVM